MLWLNIFLDMFLKIYFYHKLSHEPLGHWQSKKVSAFFNTCDISKTFDLPRKAFVLFFLFGKKGNTIKKEVISEDGI